MPDLSLQAGCLWYQWKTLFDKQTCPAPLNYFGFAPFWSTVSSLVFPSSRLFSAQHSTRLLLSFQQEFSSLFILQTMLSVAPTYFIINLLFPVWCCSCSVCWVLFFVFFFLEKKKTTCCTCLPVTRCQAAIYFTWGNTSWSLQHQSLCCCIIGGAYLLFFYCVCASTGPPAADQIKRKVSKQTPECAACCSRETGTVSFCEWTSNTLLKDQGQLLS